MRFFLTLILSLTCAITATAAPTLESIDARLSAVETKLGMSTASAASTQPVPVVSAPIASPVTPTAPRTPKSLAKMVELRDAVKTVADTIFAAGTTGDAALMVRADGAVIDRVTFDRPDQYAVYVEGAQNVTIRDVKVIGPSRWQSSIRTARPYGGTKAPSVTFIRCDLSAPVNPNGWGRANFRGEGNRTFIDCRVADLQWASGPLANDDGGDKHGFTRLKDVAFDNGPAIANAVNASGMKDSATVLAAIRAAKPIVNGKPYTVTDDAWRQTLAFRAVELSASSNDTWHNCLCLYGLGLMPGAVVTLDGTNEIRVADKVVYDYAIEYPRKGSTFPWDAHRKPPMLIGNGDKITAPGGWGLSPLEKTIVLRGWFMVNGKREDYGPVSMVDYSGVYVRPVAMAVAA